MLDVHPAHNAAATWRDFFIHIATIVVGLLIAIGLEQTVEAIHHHHQRMELRDSLSGETQQILKDCERVEKSQTGALLNDQNVEQQIQDATAGKAPLQLASVPGREDHTYDVPDDPVFRAAKSSGELALLSPDEVRAYSEVDVIAEQVMLAFRDKTAASRVLGALMKQQALGKTVPPNAPAGPLSIEEQKLLYVDLLQVQEGHRIFRLWERQLHGAEVALTHGVLSLPEIQKAERQFDDLP